MSDQLAVITGAAGGLGFAYARLLHRQGWRLLLVDREQQRLEECRRQLGAEAMLVDLCSEVDLAELESELRGRRVDLLINAAGFGVASLFELADMGPQLDMVTAHVCAPMRLCKAVLPGMVERRSGSIINVASSSCVALLPTVGGATYMGTKSFLISFSRSLQAETKRHGLKIQALCPGFIRSHFHDDAQWSGLREATPFFLWTSPESVARGSLRALRSRKVVYVPGLVYKFLVAGGGWAQPLVDWSYARIESFIEARRAAADSRPPSSS